MKRRTQILILVLIFALCLFLWLVLRSCQAANDKPSESSASATLDFTPSDRIDDRIIIPCFSGLDFRAGEHEQTIDLYNPENNLCFFVIEIFLSDNTLLYQSDYIAPGEHLTSIRLSQTLQRGLYRHCRIEYSCYSLDGKAPLNRAQVVLEIKSN